MEPNSSWYNLLIRQEATNTSRNAENITQWVWSNNGNKLPRDAVESPFIKVFKIQLDKEMGNWLSLTLLWTEVWMRQSSEMPFHLNSSLILGAEYNVNNTFAYIYTTGLEVKHSWKSHVSTSERK